MADSFTTTLIRYLNADPDIQGVLGVNQDGSQKVIFFDVAPPESFINDPWFVCYPIVSPEVNTLICPEEQGQYQIQFDAYGSQTGDLYDQMTELKRLVHKTRGAIGLNYSVIDVQGVGVRALGTGVDDIQHYIFDPIFQWERSG